MDLKKAFPNNMYKWRCAGRDSEDRTCHIYWKSIDVFLIQRVIIGDISVIHNNTVIDDVTSIFWVDNSCAIFTFKEEPTKLFRLPTNKFYDRDLSYFNVKLADLYGRKISVWKYVSLDYKDAHEKLHPHNVIKSILER